jgi:hypothetical protein
MRLASTMELILVAAVGMAVASWLIHDPSMAHYYAQATWGQWLKEVSDGFLAGVALAGSIAVWIERARRRSPSPWGPGRWAWSVVGLYLILHYGFTFARRMIVGMSTSGRPIVEIVAGIPADLRASLLFWYRNAPTYILIAVVLTYLAASPEPRPRADGRELAGRVFAVVTVITGIMRLFDLGVGF